MPKRILSTDPNAGLQSTTVGTKRILSTDPSAGLDPIEPVVGKRVLSTDPSAGLGPSTGMVEEPSILGRSLDVVQRIGNTLGRLGSSTAAIANEGVEAYQQGQSPVDFASDALGAVKDTFTPTGIGTFKRNDDFNKVLGTAGMDEGYLRSGLGFVGDVVLDPLNIGVVAKTVGKVAKVPFTAINKATDVIPGINTAKNAVKESFVIPKFAEHVNQNVGETAGLAYGDMKRLGESAQRAGGEHAEAFAENFFKDIKDPQKLSKFIHAQDRGISTGDAALDALKPKWQQKMDELFQTQVDLDLLDPSMKRANYVPYQTKNLAPRDMEAVVGAGVNATTDASKKREIFKTLQDAITKGGAEADPRKILATAITEVERAKATHEFLTDTVKAFGKESAVPGFKKLNTGNLKIGKALKEKIGTTYVPEKIANDLERAVVLWEKPSELDGLYKTGMKVWKSMATSINPGHHFTNFLGNVSNMFVGGMDAKDIAKGYMEGAKIARAKTPEQAAKLFPKIGEYTSEQLYKAANKWEILGTSSMLGDLAEKGTKEWVANNPVFKGGRVIGTRYVEEPARVGMFLHEIRKGKTPAEAAIRVKDVLFDYSELTDAEKKLRDYAVPFYTWLRKNIPLQMEAIYKNPAKLEKMKDFQNMFWNANESAANENVISEKGQKAGFVPTGTHDGMLTMNKINLPMMDLNKLTDAGVLGDSLNPLIKLGIEGITGNKFFGGPVQKSTGLTTPAPAASLLGLVANRVLPESMQGYVTPAQANDGRNLQNDTMSWLMNALIPTGVYGSTAKMSQGEDPMNPNLGAGREAGLRMLGLTPDVISPIDQQFEVLGRKKAWTREQKRKALLEK